VPTVAIVDGVKILFYPDEHPPPHFHARIAEFTAQISIEPLGIIKGSLPPNKVKNVMGWAATRQTELMTAWIEMEAGRKPGKIA
jgi:Domain of unknown function (DUF4160)